MRDAALAIAPLLEQFSPFHEPEDVHFDPPHPLAPKAELTQRVWR
jgi:hypothetical protein